MKFTNLLADEALLNEMGARLARARLERGWTQADLAEAAAISKSTVERLEAGGSSQLSNWLRCLRALQLLENLEGLLPDDGPSPIELLERHGQPRKRARNARSTPPAPWSWGEG